MSEPSGYLVGLRVDPDTETAEWFTVWFEDEAGQDRVLDRSGRALWMREPAAACELGQAVLDGRYSIGSEVESVCDVAETLYAIASRVSGSEKTVLDSLNLLYDVLNTVGQSSELPSKRVLDQLVVHLTTGEPLPTAVDRVGGPAAVIEPILSSLGRLFALSTFEC